jgi:hypothetical protein
MATALGQVLDVTFGSIEREWADEIRDYLLGRLSKQPASPPVRERLPDLVPVRRWWMFEGKHYAPLDGTLATRWDRAHALALALSSTFNPRVRITNRPEANIDWPQTLVAGLGCVEPTFVVRSSGVGLSPDEHAALAGWCNWIDARWRKYACRWGLPANGPLGRAADANTGASREQLRRWLHLSKRSRWPFLRLVVAESLRVELEADELLRLPLPRAREALFELLCLVRLARSLAPRPTELRWLGLEHGPGELRLEGVRCRYQLNIPKERVLQSPWYEGGLARAVDAFRLRARRRLDLLLEFSTPRAGFSGCIVEVKSGERPHESAIEQLRIYSSAIARRPGTRYVIWSIVESDQSTELDRTGRAHLQRERCGADDVWVFSSANAVGDVLQQLGLVAGKAMNP